MYASLHRRNAMTHKKGLLEKEVVDFNKYTIYSFCGVIVDCNKFLSEVIYKFDENEA